MRRRHSNIDHDELGSVYPDELEQLCSIGREAHDVELRSLEQARKPLAKKDIVVRDDHTRRNHRHLVSFITILRLSLLQSARPHRAILALPAPAGLDATTQVKRPQAAILIYLLAASSTSARQVSR
jgi:hypothetical protein